MNQIDHDPNEPPRPYKGEQLFVTIVTVVVLSGLALFLRWVAKEGGLGIFAVVCVAIVAICFAIAFRLERSKSQRLW